MSVEFLILQCLLKDAKLFVDHMIIQIVYTFGFAIVAFKNALLSREEKNICQNPAESLSCMCLSASLKHS